MGTCGIHQTCKKVIELALYMEVMRLGRGFCWSKITFKEMFLKMNKKSLKLLRNKRINLCYSFSLRKMHNAQLFRNRDPKLEYKEIRSATYVLEW